MLLYKEHATKKKSCCNVKTKGLTSWEVNLSRYIMMDLSEFPWAAIITFFPD